MKDAKHDPKIEAAVNSLLERFKQPDSLEMVANHIIPAPNIPSARWSLGNRLLCLMAGTMDARGYKQWLAVGRHVMKGRKAFPILKPWMVNVEKEEIDDATGKREKVSFQALRGFLSIPVFRYEDTDGAPLDMPNVEPPTPPPLREVADRLGLTVSYTGLLGDALGTYSDTQKAIRLASHDAEVWFHELAHAAHYRVDPKAREAGRPDKEIIAEASAGVLLTMYGGKVSRTVYDYIDHYAGGKDPITACIRLLSKIEKVVRLIVDTAAPAQEEPTPQAAQ